MKDVHTEHCCALHGCKYGQDDCTVINAADKNLYVQSFTCETCDMEGIKTVEDVIRKLHPTYGTFANHVILYAKNWYGSSYVEGNGVESILNDLRVLKARFYGLYEEHVSDTDVRCAILETFDKFYDRADRLETFKEAFGWRWGRDNGAMSDREPEVAFMGKLSVTRGECVYKPDIYTDVCFTRETNGCNSCHRRDKEEGSFDYCGRIKVTEVA